MLIAQKEAEEEEDPGTTCTVYKHASRPDSIGCFRSGIGHVTTDSVLTLLYLAAYPEVQAKLHAEVDRVLGERRVPMLSERHKLPYTEAVLYESMRKGAVAPLGLPHSTTCDTTVAGYEIPKGTIVLANIFAIHHDPRHWKEPEVFNPERFLTIPEGLHRRLKVGCLSLSARGRVWRKRWPNRNCMLSWPRS
ncbi:cytochrome P450 2J1-like [Haliotis rubra]|uniref:cytochrome P450 2J1-like n=1 Tax=Haliotis rubra TaxID=36100 RepID=UPI001EE56851|nr:cytochrome P450 2J1-like [Haliotis rubra]